MAGNDNLIGGMVLGAGLMYLLDPDRGRRRRAVLRDQAAHLAYRVPDAAATTARDLQNRTEGLVAEAGSRLRSDTADDAVLEARVRSELGRLVSHPGAVHVMALDGRVVLEGPVLADEVDTLLAGVRSVRGVDDVENRLKVHESAGDVPGLQGRGRRPESMPELLQENWTPAVRLLAGMVGGALALRGMRGRNALDTVAALAGVGILSRAVTNLSAARLVGVGAGRRAVDVQKTLNVDAPLEEVFSFWSHFENFPRFMSHLKEVRRTGEGTSHWVAAGPGGVPVAWDAETSAFVPNEVIGWRSVEGSPVANAGIVRFRTNPDGTTRIEVRMSYNPPAGAVGHAVAALFGADPRRAMDEDMVRLKSLLEAGRTSAEGRTVTRESLETAEAAPGRTQGAGRGAGL